jgi:GT2 family glycosyltransferase
VKDSQSQNLKVSIIVLSLNRKDKTIDCLNSVYKNTKIPYELIVVDQGSCDADLHKITIFCEFVEAKLIKVGCNLGVAGGRNLALNYVNSELVYFLDNDIIVAENWLEPLIETLELEENKRVIACCSQLRKDGKLQTQGRVIQNGKIQYSDDGLSLDNNAINAQNYKDLLPGGCTLYRKEAFDISCLDSRFFIGYEDLDFFMQLRNQGYKLLNCPKSVVNHFPDVEKNDYYEVRRNRKHLDRSKKIFIKKWGDIL